MIDGRRSRLAQGAPAADAATGPLRGKSPFGQILRRAVEATPGAIGGAFADSQGELIDGYTTHDPEEWALVTAHYGIVLGQLHAAFGTWHFGGPEYFIAQHAQLDIVVHAVDGGYYALMALTAPAPLGRALIRLREAAQALHQELA